MGTTIKKGLNLAQIPPEYDIEHLQHGWRVGWHFRDKGDRDANLCVVSHSRVHLSHLSIIYNSGQHKPSAEEKHYIYNMVNSYKQNLVSFKSQPILSN